MRGRAIGEWSKWGRRWADGGLRVTATRPRKEQDGHELDRKRQDEEMPGRAGMKAHAWRQPWAREVPSSQIARRHTHTHSARQRSTGQAICRTASGQASCRVHETCGVAIRAAQRRGHGAACKQELSFPNRRQGLRSPRQVKSRKHKVAFKCAKAGAHTGTGAKAAAPVVSSTSPTAAPRGALHCPANMAFQRDRPYDERERHPCHELSRRQKVEADLFPLYFGKPN